MKKYKYLLFDVDGTLLDFNKAEEQALINTFQKYNIVLTEQMNQRYEQINKQLWKDFENGLIDKKTIVYTRFVQLFQEFGIDEDGIAFEDDYQDALGEGYFLLITFANGSCEYLPHSGYSIKNTRSPGFSLPNKSSFNL